MDLSEFLKKLDKNIISKKDIECAIALVGTPTSDYMKGYLLALKDLLYLMETR